MWHFFDRMYIQFLKSKASIYPTSLTSWAFPSPNLLKVIRLLRQKVSGTELKNCMKLKESLCDTSSSEPYRTASINTAENGFSVHRGGITFSEEWAHLDFGSTLSVASHFSLPPPPSHSGVVHSHETGN